MAIAGPMPLSLSEGLLRKLKRVCLAAEAPGFPEIEMCRKIPFLTCITMVPISLSLESEKYSYHFLFCLLEISFVAVHVFPKQSHVQLIPFLREVGVLSSLYILLILRATPTHQR